ncbi:hypothetical protein M8J76_007993 [Diaphorina citri]|nr:hypothetical protein M8J75_014066 [Diaphorina citri]KAI5733129.1 hypothetical protein M8J76_007993 [Diaphorina citri]
MGKDSLHSSSTHTMHTRHSRSLHTCFKRRSSRPCLRQRPLCSCKLRKQCSKFYSQLRRDQTASTAGGFSPPALPTPRVPSPAGAADAGNINVNDHIKEIFLKTARQLQAGDPEKVDTDYADIYTLYSTVFTENRKLKEKLRHLGGGDISDPASSRESSEEEGGDMYTNPIKKIYKLYKKLVRQNYKMQKIILSKSS